MVMRALADSLLPNCSTLTMPWGPGKALEGLWSQGRDQGKAAWKWGKGCTEGCLGRAGMWGAGWWSSLLLVWRWGGGGLGWQGDRASNDEH